MTAPYSESRHTPGGEGAKKRGEFPRTIFHLKCPFCGASHYADVAQLAERVPCKDKVAGSSPAVGSIFSP